MEGAQVAYMRDILENFQVDAARGWGGEVAYMKCIMENFLVHRTGERGPVFYIRDIIENFQVH